MRINKYIEFAQEVEIDLDSEDISVIYSENDGSVGEWLGQVNSIATFLIGTPTKTLEQLTTKQAEACSNFLREQAERIYQYVESHKEGLE